MTASPKPPEPAAPPVPRRLPGWARGGLLVLGVPVLLLAIAWAWQAIDLARIPDVGDPFDVAAFEREFPRIPDDRNAYADYRRAVAALPMPAYKLREGVAWVEDWPYASDELKERVATCRPALDLWRQGADQDEAMPHRLAEVRGDVTLEIMDRLRRVFVPLALLEGSRLETAGDMEGAWGWYRALLRCSRHSGRNGFLIERVVGASLHEQAAARIRRWAADDRVDARLLAAARDEVRRIEASTPPDAELGRLDYLADMRTCGDPKLLQWTIDTYRQNRNPRPYTTLGWYLAQVEPDRLMGHARVHTGYEAERSRRVARLIWSNRMAQWARPAAERAPFALADSSIYAPDPTAPAAANALPPAELARRQRASVWGILPGDPYRNWVDKLDQERDDRARLIADLGAELDRRAAGPGPRTGDTP